MQRGNDCHDGGSGIKTRSAEDGTDGTSSTLLIMQGRIRRGPRTIISSLMSPVKRTPARRDPRTMVGEDEHLLVETVDRGRMPCQGRAGWRDSVAGCISLPVQPDRGPAGLTTKKNG